MPKELITWKCEDCGFAWDTEKEASACETNHLKLAVISKYFYDGEKEKFPNTVEMTFPNGVKKYYVLEDDCN